MPTNTLRKKEGFLGQKAIVIPRKILSTQCATDKIINTLYVTDIGYYPKAKFHYRERPHGTDQHILVYCVEGCGEATIKNISYNIGAGDFFVIPKKTAHTYSADENNPWTIYWLHFKGSISDSIISLIKKQMNGLKGSIVHNDNTINIFNEIYNQLVRGYSMEHLIYSNMCFSHFLSTFAFNDKYETKDKLNYRDSIELAIDFLSSKINEVLTLEQMASAVNLSPSHFSFLFRKKTGFSPIEYFNHLKVQKACQYLSFTSLRIKELSLEFGIKDQYYFSRMFTKVMGISPNEYREKHFH